MDDGDEIRLILITNTCAFMLINLENLYFHPAQNVIGAMFTFFCCCQTNNQLCSENSVKIEIFH